METKIMVVAAPKVKQVKAYVEPKATKLMQTKEYKQACQLESKGLTYSVITCEKVIGKEKTKSLIQTVEGLIPASWKPAPATKPAPVAQVPAPVKPAQVPAPVKKLK